MFRHHGSGRSCKRCGRMQRDAPPSLLYKTTPVELKVNVDDWTFEGLGSTFEPPERHDSHGDILGRDAFNRSIAELGPTETRRSSVIHLWQHDETNPIGLPTVLEAQDRGLFFRGKLSKTQANRDYLILMDDGVVTKNSIGYVPRAIEWLETHKTPWGTPVRRLIDVDLAEISPVTFASNPFASILGVGLAKHWSQPMLETKSGMLVPAASVCTCDVPHLGAPPAHMCSPEFRKQSEIDLKRRFSVWYDMTDAEWSAIKAETTEPEEVEPMLKKGEALATWFASITEPMIAAGDTTREELIEAIALAGGLDAGAVADIASGTTACPTPQAIAAMAEVLGSTAADIEAVAAEDGCAPAGEEEVEAAKSRVALKRLGVAFSSKAGRTLSAKNEGLLLDAQSTIDEAKKKIDEVVASVRKAEDADGEEDEDDKAGKSAAKHGTNGALSAAELDTLSAALSEMESRID